MAMDSSGPMEEAWDEAVDVLVVGSGFAGLAAAIEAADAGASVTVLEKMKSLGGNSIISDGGIAAVGTPIQEREGITDSPELMFEDMLKAGRGLNHPDLARVVAESSNEVLQWTIDDLGVEYLDRVDQFGGHSVPRCYTPLDVSGATIIKRQLAKARELGVDVRTQMYLESLLTDAQGNVCGVGVRDGYAYPKGGSGVPRRIKAEKAVILATGGFGSDVAFRAVQDPRLTKEVDTTNRRSGTAEALLEALRIGATPLHLSWIQLGPWASPDERGYGVGPGFADYIAFLYGIVVDPSTGQRFANELADRRTMADGILDVGQPCVGIADTKGVEQSGWSIDRCLRTGVVKQFDRLEDFASSYGLPLGAFEATIARYSGYVERGKDKEFGKPIVSDAEPLVHPPYYGIRLWPKVHHTMGGVQIDTKAQVIGLDRQPIAGLYAAGEVTGGVHGACRLGSCAVTDCLVFGRIAGRNAAAEGL